MGDVSSFQRALFTVGAAIRRAEVANPSELEAERGETAVDRAVGLPIRNRSNIARRALGLPSARGRSASAAPAISTPVDGSGI